MNCILKNIVFCFLIIFSSFFSKTFANTESIPLTLIGRDSRTGMQINPEFEVVSIKTGLKLPVVKEGIYFVVKVLTGDDIQINAKADGYYPDEKKYSINEEFSSEGRNIVFELDPQPSSNISLEIKDKVNGKLLEATVEYKLDNKTVKKIILNKNNLKTPIIFTQPGDYSIIINADGYEEIIDKISIVVNDPPEKQVKTYELEKKRNILNLNVMNNSTKELLKEVSIRISDNKGNVLKNDVLANGKTELNLKGNSELYLKAEKNGFYAFSEKVFVEGENLTIALKEKSSLIFEIKDGYNNNMITSDIELTAPSGKKIQLKSKDTEKVVFYPEEKGNYTILVSKKEYQEKTEKININDLNASVFPVTIKLLSIYEDFMLWIVNDKKQVVPQSDVRVLDENNNELPIEFNKSTNEWIVKLIKNKSYSYIATAENFDVNKGNLDLSKGKLIPIKLSEKTNEVSISAVDKYSGVPVKTTIEYEGMPKELIGKENEKHEIKITTNQKIKPILSAKGYQKYQTDLIDKKTETTVLMLADSYIIDFEVFDSETNKPIVPTSFTIINKRTSEPTILNFSEKRNVNLNAEENYYLEIKTEGYNDHSSPFLPSSIISKNGGKNTKTIKLSPKTFVSKTIKVIGSETMLPIPNVEITVSNDKGEAYNVVKNNQNWTVDLKNGEAFKVKASADGYETLISDYDNLKNTEIIEIVLIKTQTKEVVFEAYDEVLKKQVPVKFSLYSDGKFEDLKTYDNGVHAKTQLEKNKEYTIRISAADYKDKEKSFTSSENIEDIIVLRFKKTTYPIKIVLERPTNSKQLGTPNLAISSENKKVETKYLFDKQLFMAEIPAEGQMKLVLSVTGFKSHTETFTIEDLVKSDMTKVIKLEEIEEPKVEEPKIEEPKVEEPKIEEPKKEIIEEKKIQDPPIVIEEKVVEKRIEKQEPVIEKTEPLKLETVYSQNKENLEEIPESNDAIAAALTSKESIGKRYILTKVYFEKSTPTMKQISEEQLNSILNVLKENKKLKIELVGHTDNVGDKRQNEYLSTFRAKVVSNFLFNKGIENNRIIVKGLGDKFPVEPNDTEENKSKNRRVELIVIEN